MKNARIVKVSILSMFLLLSIAGCMYPQVQPWLWRDVRGEIPKQIVLSRDVTCYEGKQRDKYVLPAGAYELWYENKFGYYYRQQKVKIRKTTGAGVSTEFEGGFQLAKRIDMIGVYQLVTMAEDAKAHGELTSLAAWEQGDKDGMTRSFVANVQSESYPEFGFPEHQPKPR